MPGPATTLHLPAAALSTRAMNAVRFINSRRVGRFSYLGLSHPGNPAPLLPPMTPNPVRPAFSPALLIGLVLAATATLSAQPALVPPPESPRLEAAAEFVFAGRSAVAEGTVARGEIETARFRVDAIRTLPRDGDSSWSIGGVGEQLRFAPAPGAPIPATLSSLALKLGYNRQFTPRWALSAQLAPGIYGRFDATGGLGLNAPFTLRVIAVRSRDLQWVFGASFDPRSGHPLLGAAGVRWQLAPAWNLLLVAPSPRIEYMAGPALTLFAGGDLRTGAYQVGRRFGRERGRPELDNQFVDYRELSVTAGARWQVSPAVKVSAAAGWMLDRRFEFADRDLLLNGKGAPVFQLLVTGRF